MGATMGDVVVGDRIIAPRDASLHHFAEGATVVVEEIEDKGEGFRLYELGDHDDGVLYAATYHDSDPVEIVASLASLLTTPLTTADEAEAWIRAIYAIGYGTHPDDRAADVVDAATGEALFNADDARLYDERMTEAFDLVGDPYVIALDALGLGT